MIHDDRITPLNDSSAAKGKYVLYWMQASQRATDNHALEYAVREANSLKLPMLACFGLMDDYPEANERHYAFMLEGLAQTEQALAARGVKLVAKHGPPPKVALHYAKSAALLVCDRGYLRHQRAWRDEVADHAKCPVVQVESDVIVPVEAASDHAEYAARTIRPKIRKQLKTYLAPLCATSLQRPSVGLRIAGDFDLQDFDGTLARLKLDRSVKRVSRFAGGPDVAKKLLSQFVNRKLAHYGDDRNDPATQGTSTMAAYLHFGQISPLTIALKVKAADAPAAEREAYLEELIVRRELAMNHCQFNARYDKYECLPAWAQKTLSQHQRDKRPYTYTRRQLEAAETHDEYWNAAQREMTQSGYIHNYMRMYWGKKILEWKQTAKQAFADTLYLNNKHFLCGRDPNSYANVAWIFGLHDRPWGPARPIFGTVRYMNAAGLERKFDMDAYVKFVDALPA